MKQCKTCGEDKPLSSYYKHSQMKDGHLNKCIECTKKRVAKHRAENIEKIRAYDRARGNRQPIEYLREYRKRYPKKYKAHTAINNALRSGKMRKMPCEICGYEKTEAHHDDYDYPLNVRWLCSAHHSQWHSKNGEAKNAF